MTHSVRVVLLAVLLAAMCFSTLGLVLPAQVQTSGGGQSNVGGLAASGAAKSGNPVQVGGVFNTTQPTVTSGQVVEHQSTARGADIVATGIDAFNVTVNAALPAGSNAIGSVTNTGFNVTGSLPAGTNSIGTVKIVPTTSCGGTFFEQPPALMPSANTSITSTTTCVTSMYFVNVTSSAVTITVTDGQVTPVTLVATFSLPGNSDVMRTFPYGLKGVSGVKWQAGSSSAVVGQVSGFQ